MTENKLLIMDDEPEICNLVADVAGTLGFSTAQALTQEQLQAINRTFTPTAIVLDLKMPDVDGIEVIRMLAAEKSRAKIVLVSGEDMKVLSTAQRLGTEVGLSIVGILHKPFNVEQLRSALRPLFIDSPIVTEAELAAALNNGDIVPYFQPKVSLKEGAGKSVESAEALVRWRHPRLGVLTPDRFLPLVEKTQMMDDLTHVVLKSVLLQIGEWKAQGHSIQVAVNLSADCLDDLELPDRMATIASVSGVEPASVQFEITESAAMANATKSMDVLTRLRIKGFGLAMDDFGTGYSSLVQLYRLPFSEIKIDRSFVKDAEDSREAQAIIRLTIGLAGNLNLSVCAEGVETDKVAEFLRAEKCDQAQGYLFGRPMPAAEFPRFVGGWDATRSCRAAWGGQPL